MKPLQSIWKNGFENMFQFVLDYGWMILVWGVRVPKAISQRPGHLVPVGVYPNTQKELDTKAIPRGQTLAPVSPYLDEMMMTNVRQFQIPRFPNDKRFQTKLCAEVVNSVPRCGLLRKMVMGYGLLVSFAPLPLPYDDHKMEPKRHVSHKTSIYLRAPLKHRTTSSFLCASS